VNTDSQQSFRSGPEAGPGPEVSQFDKLFALRDRMLESQDFQRFSSAFPLTRGVARREAQQLFDLCAGFVYSQILFACISLGVFDALKGGPLSLAVLSDRLSLPNAATERLMRAAVALRLVARRGQGRYGLGMLGAALNGNPSIAAMIRHHALLYRDLADPVSLLRGERKGELSHYWAYASETDNHTLVDARVAEYSTLMAQSQTMIAQDILDAYPLDRHRLLLDIGGGEGVFIAAAASRYPQLCFQLFDLPAVADRAADRFAQNGLTSRTEVFRGSFETDALPTGADVVTLVRVLHDHDDAAVLGLLRKVRANLPADGAVLVAEPFAQTPGSERVGDAYFGFYLLAMGQGRPRSGAELTGMLREAGFGKICEVPTRLPMLTSALLAKPA
jgi:demethylspheroidene O-methyltransferase